MKFGFHREALVEFEAAADFYAECQAGLEVRFIDAVSAAISHACDAPTTWRSFDGEVRRVLVHVFPYAVLYFIEDGLISIIAVMHCGREPGYWKSRKR